MPMLLGTKGNDILQWRAAADLVALLKGKLARSWEQGAPGEAESFLDQYIGALREEMGYETQLTSDIDALNAGIAEVHSLGKLLPLKTRYQEVVSAHFRRRRSVLALSELCCALHDRLLAKALALAEERMLRMGQGPAPPYALLVSGDRARGEQTLKGKNRYFLLHQDQTHSFLLLQHQVATALEEFGLPGGAPALWHGSLGKWRDFVGEGAADEEVTDDPFPAPLPPFAAPPRVPAREDSGAEGHLETLAELSFAWGEAPLAEAALATAAGSLLKEVDRDPFLQSARQTMTLPLALGRFGRWRLERGSERRGELNLTQFALTPLVSALRVLALHAGIQAKGTVERIQRLREKGALEQDLAQSVLRAFQCFMQLRILIEMRGEEGDAFCRPEEFSAETEVRFRSALDAVASLQKVGNQRLLGQV
jgi:CBS domain-containing protein